MTAYIDFPMYIFLLFKQSARELLAWRLFWFVCVRERERLTVHFEPPPTSVARYIYSGGVLKLYAVCKCKYLSFDHVLLGDFE